MTAEAVEDLRPYARNTQELRIAEQRFEQRSKQATSFLTEVPRQRVAELLDELRRRRACGYDAPLLVGTTVALTAGIGGRQYGTVVGHPTDVEKIADGIEAQYRLREWYYVRTGYGKVGCFLREGLEVVP